MVPKETSDQIRQAFDNLNAALKLAGADLDTIVKLNVYVSDPAIFRDLQVQMANRCGKSLPAVTWVASGLPNDGTKVALDAVAFCRESANREILIGNAVDVGARSGSAIAILSNGPRVYISGQAEKGDGTLASATRDTLQSLFESLEFVG